MSTHKLKTWPAYFDAVLDGRKRFELRKADRDFAVDDTLLLCEWSPETEGFTGRTIEVTVTYIALVPFNTTGDPTDVVMSIR